MNLLENLARNVDGWPDCDFIVQDDGGICWPSMNGKATYNDGFWSSNIPELNNFVLEKSEDNDTAKVTRAEWQSERQRIALEGISQFSQEQDNAIERQLRDESAKQYERELWDNVAVNTLSGMLASWPNDSEPIEFKTRNISDAMDYADAFMVERAKRMKGK